MRFKWVIGVILSVCVSGCTDAQDSSFEDVIEPFSITVPGDVNLPVVPIMIGEKGPYKFALDTGSSSTVVSNKVLLEIGVSKQDAFETTGALTQKGLMPILSFDAKWLTIENTEIEQRVALFSLPEQGDSINPIQKAFDDGVDGILGVDFLSGMKLSNSGKSQTITLTKVSNEVFCSSEMTVDNCYEARVFLPIINSKFEDQNFEILLDSGASGTRSVAMMSKSPFSNKIWTHYENNDIKINIPSRSDKSLRMATLTGVRYGNGSLKCDALLFVRDPLDSSTLNKNSRGIIGWDALKKIDFEINFHTRQIKGFESKCLPSAHDRSGRGPVQILDGGNKFKLLKVAKNSPAQEAGLRNGDIVTRVAVKGGKVFSAFPSAAQEFRAIDIETIFLPSGNTIIFWVLRGNQEVEIPVVLRTYHSYRAKKSDSDAHSRWKLKE